MSANSSPRLPRRLLYATSARIGGSGLDSVAFESIRAAHQRGFLGLAIAYADRQHEIPRSLIKSLRAHPVRLLSWLKSPYYYGAKKHYLDWISTREIERGGYDFFHGWSGDCLHTLRAAKRHGVPSVLEIPTWHRHKGKYVPAKTRREAAIEHAPLPERLLNRLLVSRQQVLEEYELADLILVLSEKAAETFAAAGIPRSKLFKLERGVDVERFAPGGPPEVFRALFVGALIKRKGVHLLLEAWDRLQLKNAELLLVGTAHEEIKPRLAAHRAENTKLIGFSARPEDFYRQSSVHILPSSCEGSAKTTYEAAACGLPQITTRESGDVVIDGFNGIVIPADDVDALAAAIQRLYDDPVLRQKMGAAARERVVGNFTWEHFRERLLQAYEHAMQLAI